MHNLFLGLLKEHFRRILGFCIKTKRDKAMSGAVNIDIPDDTHIPLEDKHIKSVKSIKRLLEQLLAEVFSNAQELYKFENKLFAKSHPALFYITNRLSCLDLDISQSIEARDRWTKGLKKRRKIPTNSGKPSSFTKEVLALKLLVWVCRCYLLYLVHLTSSFQQERQK